MTAGSFIDTFPPDNGSAMIFSLHGNLTRLDAAGCWSRLFWKSELEAKLQGPEVADYGSSLSIANIKLSEAYNWFISVSKFPELLPPFSFIHYLRSPSPVRVLY